MTSVEVWATMRVTVDVEAVKREIGEPDPWPGDPEPQERTDQEIALDYVNGEAGATIDNHITVQEIVAQERDDLREELAAYKGAIEQIQRAITEYKTDRMWASALRRIESLTHRPEVDIAAQRERQR